MAVSLCLCFFVCLFVVLPEHNIVSCVQYYFLEPSGFLRLCCLATHTIPCDMAVTHLELRHDERSHTQAQANHKTFYISMADICIIIPPITHPHNVITFKYTDIYKAGHAYI